MANSVLCKCCRASCRDFGDVNFSKTCADAGGKPFPDSPETVHYLQCEECGFVFTRDFDALSDDEMAARIYNEDYGRADPEFAEIRPKYFSELLAPVLRVVRPDTTILDYGGGRGHLAECFRAKGFSRCDSFDPYFGDAPKPHGTYDLVSAIEVAEHSRDPAVLFAEVLTYTRERGCAFISTMLQPADVEIDWWYIAPRNGHVSIYSERSLRRLAARFGVHVVSLDPGTHILFRDPDSPLVRSFLRCFGRSALYHASTRGLNSFAATARRLSEAGLGTLVLNPRHAARAIAYSLRPPRDFGRLRV